MLNSIFTHSGYLGKALDASWLRNEVITNNIANVDTPNFKSSRVEFESVLKNAFEDRPLRLKKTRADHIEPSNMTLEPAIIRNSVISFRMDGNNVDMDKEQLELVRNVIYYNTLIQKIGKEFGRIRTAINEGK